MILNQEHSKEPSMQMFGLHKSIYKLNRALAPEENFA